MIRRRGAQNSDIERKIITGIIISTQFCREILHVIRIEFFTIEYARHIIRWCSNYFKKYQEAPGKQIQDIFEAEKKKLGIDESELIEAFLSSLSKQYEEIPEFNYQYLRDQALVFFRERNIENTIRKAGALLDISKPDDAETVMRDFQKVSKSISSWTNPFDKKAISSMIEEEEHEFFKFHGKLGQLLGNWRRDELIGIMAPSKRGKSWMLLETGVHAMLSGLNSIYINLEMAEGRLLSRFYRRLTAMGEYDGDYIYPAFDCKRNQDGSCIRKERSGRRALLGETVDKPKFSPELDYKICTYCRELGITDYIPETWFTVISRKKLSYNSILKELPSIEEFVGNKMRMRTYPAFEAPMSTILADIEFLEFSEEFVPDVIVIDYVDILAPEGREEGRDFYDKIWKQCKNLAMKKHCLVVTATQSNRASFDKRSIKMTDASEDIRKVQHVDRMVMLSQTQKEKDAGIMRVSAIHRHEHFSENMQIQIIQNFDTGQIVLDSERINWSDD